MDLQEYGSKSMKEVREKVMDLLATYYARGAIQLEEYESRMEIATRSETRADLEALVGNLPALPRGGEASQAAATDVVPGGGLRAADSGDVRETQTLASVFSAVSRKGEWYPARHTQAVAFFGSTDLDLRQAHLPPGVSKISVLAFFGSVTILVPPGINVEMNGVGVIGEFSSNVPEVRRGAAPTIVVDGLAAFASATVRVKQPRLK
jgi:hypothetical protein